MKSNEIVSNQKEAFEKKFSPDDLKIWDFHLTPDPLVRYIRDRMLRVGLKKIFSVMNTNINEVKNWKVLVVCGGVGGEGHFLHQFGFNDVTVSDFSENALGVCNHLFPALKTLQLNSEDMDLADKSYDLVVVQAGLHHLSRPALGLTEMLRVAHKAILVLEPHTGFLPTTFGTEWEIENGFINYVFRWNDNMLKQITKSYLLKEVHFIKGMKTWNHNLGASKIVKPLPKPLRLPALKFIYGVLNTLFGFWGNKFIGVVVKEKSIK
jgi:ubiquinone/menaquinone biosynthesis C-methylase UbiE